MYEEYFGLKEEPFSIAPDPHYVYMSRGHREALAHLLYGIERDGGFVLLTGEVGTGKTTVCRCLLDEVPETTDVAFILNPNLTVDELLATICDEFRINYPEGNRSVKVFVSRINDYLLDTHSRDRKAVLIIEEAQNLSTEVLEQIRLLTNLETSQRKLLQIIMVGQPEITEKLSQPELRQLSQRITARYHLGPLSQNDVTSYVKYRLSVAGLIRGDIFPRSALKKLYRLTGGVPRLINVICDRALLGSYVQGKDRVDLKTLQTAAREVSGARPLARRRRIYRAVAAAFILTLCIVPITVHYMTGHFAPDSRPIWRATIGTLMQEPAAGAKTETVRASLVEWPGPQGPNTKDMAYRTLFDRWAVGYDGETALAVHEQARRHGLQCMQGTGNVSDLRQMNKPVVLKLLDNKSDEYHATLTSLRGEEAVLMIGGKSRTVDVKELSKWWSGEYLLLWRAPREYKKELNPGESGPLVTWVDRQLSLAQGRPAEARQGLLYGDELVKRVKEFQRAAGLRPDGIVGPWTIMRLSAVDKHEPALDEGQGG